MKKYVIQNSKIEIINITNAGPYIRIQKLFQDTKNNVETNENLLLERVNFS